MTKLIITATQMMRLLDSQSPKFPITVKLKGFTEKEKEELFKKIKEANK